MLWLLFVLFGYLSGSVLYCYYLPLWIKGLDITKDSSDKNPGAFNCISRAGAAIGIPALLFDLLKGTLPILLACNFLDVKNLTFAIVLAAPVLGHAFPIFRNFRGGKAITVTFGTLLGLLPFWQPVVLLAVIYIFFSLVIQIYPNRSRSMLTFFCFGVLSVVWIRAAPCLSDARPAPVLCFLSTNFHLWVKTRLFFAKLPFGSKYFFNK